MYLPRHFEETRVDILHELIRAHPLATLVTLSSDGLNANHIPLHLVESPSPFGTLQGHVARANPLLADLPCDIETLAVFQGADHYMSPSLYATKAETGKVVPTWNYAVVHAYGYLRVVDDKAWLGALLERLTAHHEAASPQPWSVSDAPADYIDLQLKAIVGVEMVITRCVGKMKLSQNQPARNQASIVAGMRADDAPSARAMAALVQARAQKPA
ncbi:MAG: FMN-binding negative transcriptional regulator [Pusillimonas sp.]